MDTKIWNDITRTYPTDEDYRQFDIAVSEILTKIIDASSESGVIRLYGFNRKSKSHLAVFRIALMARDLCGFSLEIDCSLWDLICVNWRIRKGFRRVNRCKPMDGRVFQDGLYMPAAIRHSRYNAFSLADVYEAYYEGSCN